jgi:hypothetical protein
VIDENTDQMKTWVDHPQRIFLLDGIGAFLTAAMLMGVLAPFEAVFGMPREVLFVLAAIAGVFAMYSLSCYRFAGQHWRPLLKVISIANLLYCCLTLALVVLLYSQLTLWGVGYFLLEIAVVLGVVVLEWRVLQAGSVGGR